MKLNYKIVNLKKKWEILKPFLSKKQLNISNLPLWLKIILVLGIIILLLLFLQRIRGREGREEREEKEEQEKEDRIKYWEKELNGKTEYEFTDYINYDKNDKIAIEEVLNKNNSLLSVSFFINTNQNLDPLFLNFIALNSTLLELKIENEEPDKCRFFFHPEQIDPKRNFLYNILRYNTSLKYIKLPIESIKKNDLLTLFYALKENKDTKLENFTFYNKKLDLEDVIKISEILDVNTSLKSINLLGTQIEKESFEIIKTAFKKSVNLRSVCGMKENETVLDVYDEMMDADLYDELTDAFFINMNYSNNLNFSDIQLLTLELNNVKIFNLHHEIRNQVSGSVSKVMVSQDNTVEKNQHLMTITTNEMEIIISSPVDGKIESVLFKEGDFVEYGKTLISILYSVEKKTNNILKSLNLDSNNITDVQSIGEGLKTNHTLTKLSLDNNNITDVKSIAEALKTNHTLTNLSLENNNITDVQSIAEALKTNNTLETLYLHNNNITDVKSIAEALQTNNTLEGLYLNFNNITDVQSISEALKTNKVLYSLELFDNNITDVQSIGEALQENKGLEALELDNNNISDVQSIGKALQTNNTLEDLWLNRNNISDVQSIGEGLKTNNTLMRLYLNNNNIENVKSIGEALKVITSLKYLDLSNNNITDQGGLDILDGLKENKSLEGIYLNKNNFKQETIQLMFRTIYNNSTIKYYNFFDISVWKGNEVGDYIDIAQGFDELSKKLDLLNLDYISELFDENDIYIIIEFIKKNNSLKKIEIPIIGDKGIEIIKDFLKTNSTLTSIEILRNKIGPDIAKTIPKMLQNHPSLEKFGELYKEEGWNRIPSLAQQAESLSGITAYPPSLIRNIEGNIDYTFIIFYDALKENTTFTYLGCFGNEIDDEGSLVIAEALKVNTSLTYISLSDNQIGNIGAKAIGDVLKKNNKIKILRLGYTGNSEDNEDGNNISNIQSIGEALKTNNTLTQLFLDNNYIVDINSIGEALKTNNTLKRLDLKYNNITDTGIQSVIEALKTNNTLNYLDLQYNNITKNLTDNLGNIMYYKINGSNGYQQVKDMVIYTDSSDRYSNNINGGF
jgi:Leucine-rich repeat (LRR) protein